jgi:hypothetical protein
MRLYDGGIAMGLKPATAPDDLVPIRAQVTKAQHDWLESEQRRLQVRSMAPVIRRAIQAAMDAETQQERAS